MLKEEKKEIQAHSKKPTEIHTFHGISFLCTILPKGNISILDHKSHKSTNSTFGAPKTTNSASMAECGGGPVQTRVNSPTQHLAEEKNLLGNLSCFPTPIGSQPIPSGMPGGGSCGLLEINAQATSLSLFLFMPVFFEMALTAKICPMLQNHRNVQFSQNCTYNLHERT